jgi:phosphocarrier protein HPr
MNVEPPPSAKLAPDERVTGSVRLPHADGMHARPAVKLSKLAKRFRSRIALRVAGEPAWTDAKSVSRVMAMRAPYDSLIEFQAVGADAHAAVEALIALVASDFLDSDS